MWQSDQLFLKISLFEIGAGATLLLASGRYFDPPDGPMNHHHDLSVSGVLNTIICSLSLFDIQISSLKNRYVQMNKNI